MKLAISNIAWQREETPAVLAVLEKLGVSGVEVAPTLLFEDPAVQPVEAIREVRRQWEGRGIDIVAMQSLLFGHPEFNLFGDEANRRAMLDYLKRIVAMGGELGARALVFGSPKNRVAGTLETGAAMAIAAGFFAEAAAVAADCGTCLCIEANPPAYGCDFVTGTADAVALVQRVDHPGFGLHLDAGAMTLTREPYAETLEAALPRLRHFHISEPFMARITDAGTDHAELGRLLRRLGYQGWVSIEMRPGLGDCNVSVVEDCLLYAIDTYAR